MTSWLRKLGRAIGSVFGRSRAATDGLARRGGVLAFRLLQSDALRSELGLSAEQIAQVVRFTREARMRRRGQFQALRQHGSDQPGPETAKLMRAVAEEVLGAIEKAGVLTPPQLERLRQITWQRQGAGAFVDDHVRKVLGITPAQERAIRGIVRDANNRVGDAGDGSAGPRTRVDGLAALRKANQEKALALLDDRQRALWDDLKGKPFEIDLEEPGPAVPGGG